MNTIFARTVKSLATCLLALSLSLLDRAPVNAGGPGYCYDIADAPATVTVVAPTGIKGVSNVKVKLGGVGATGWAGTTRLFSKGQAVLVDGYVCDKSVWVQWLSR